MAERHDLGRQESLFEGLAPPRPNPWARPPDAPPGEDESAEHQRTQSPGEAVTDTADEAALETSADVGFEVADELASPRSGASTSASEARAAHLPHDGAEDQAVVHCETSADDPQALHGETVNPPESVAGEITIERRAAPEAGPSARRDDAERLAGPTLDDVVSRMWEGLAIGLPAACPLCQGEVVPALGDSLSGSCTSCGMTID